MLKEVSLVTLLVAVTLAAPQYPVNYPFPFYNPFFPSPFPYRQAVPSQQQQPTPYVQPAPAPVSQPQAPITRTAAPVKQVSETVAPAVAAGLDPVKVEQQFNELKVELTAEIERRISLKFVEMLMTTEQLREFEEIVAAMNPLEYSHRLKETGSHDEAVRLFSHTRP